MALLLELASNRARAGMLAFLALWLFIGVSPFGVFGPKEASLWYLPTVDGPCPIGGYLSFYSRARSGAYQHKQIEQVSEARKFVDFAKTSQDRYWLAGHWPINAFSLLRARGEIGTPEQIERIQAILDAPGSQNLEQPDDGSRMLLLRSGYSDLASILPELADRIRGWLAAGQVHAQGPGASDALPDIIEVGDHLPQGADRMLGTRLLFLIDHYQSHMVFEQPEFIATYRATSWLPAADLAQAAGAEPIYRDEEFAAFEIPVEGGKIFSFAWPARYFQFKSPKPQRQSSLGK